MQHAFRIRSRIRNFPMRVSVVFLIAFAGAGPYLSGAAAAADIRA